MDVNPLHHGTSPGTGPSGVGFTRRVEPDGQRTGADADPGDAEHTPDEAEAVEAADLGEAHHEAKAEDLLQAHDPVWDALVEKDGHREATTEQVPANRGAAAYRRVSGDD